MWWQPPTLVEEAAILANKNSGYPNHLNLKSSNNQKIARIARNSTIFGWKNRLGATYFWKNFRKNETNEKFLKNLKKIQKKIEVFAKIRQKYIFRSSFGRSGSSRKSRATRRQNSSLLRRLATTNTSKKRFGKNCIFSGLGNLFFLIFPGFWRS